MNESVVKKIFEKFTTESKTVVTKEVSIENGVVDYEILSGSKHIAVEVKGTRSGEHSTIGQLLNIKRSYSHIYLLAPTNFIKKVWGILQQTNMLTDIGLMTLSNRGVRILKEPNPGRYHYNPTVRTSKKSTKKHIFINTFEIGLESNLRNKIFTVSDVAKTLNFSMANAYHRLARLKAAGMVEEVPYGGNPKRYKFVKTRKLDERIEL